MKGWKISWQWKRWKREKRVGKREWVAKIAVAKVMKMPAGRKHLNQKMKKEKEDSIKWKWKIWKWKNKMNF